MYFLGNLTFVPRGLGTGMAVRNGPRLYQLIREELSYLESFEHDTQPTIVGRTTEREMLSGYHTEDIIAMHVGVPGSTKVLIAVATHEESMVKKGVDLIKVSRFTMAHDPFWVTSVKVVFKKECYKLSLLSIPLLENLK